MLCRNPFISSAGMAFGCGHCLPCRISRKCIWGHRIILESMLHSENTFVTLTYDNDHLPWVVNSDNAVVGNLVPDDLTGFIKRLREAYEPLRLRYFGVGEYGTKTFRPHYHAVLFGFPTCARGGTRVNLLGTEYEGKCCRWCDLVRDKWGKGHVSLGPLNGARAAYAADYVVKGMTFAEHYKLKGRHPEFTRMSRKPGLGYHFMDEVASEYIRLGFAERWEDVGIGLKRDGKTHSLGRYLRNRLRELVGREEGCPPEVFERLQKEMQVVRDICHKNSVSVKKMLSAVDDPRYEQLVAKREIYKRRDTI